MVNRYEAKIVWRPQDGSPVEALTIPNARERLELQQRVADLRAAMRPSSMSGADRGRVGAAIARMFAGYPSQRNSDAQSTVATYVMELGNLPAWAIERACEAVRQGKVPDISLDFPPSSARLNQIAAAELNIAKSEKGKIEALLEVVQSAGGRTEVEQKHAEAVASAWLDRSDPRAKALVEANRPSSAKDEERRAFTESNAREFFERECRAAGISPKGGVSPSLLKIIKGEA